jgi:hypothetical protein
LASGTAPNYTAQCLAAKDAGVNALNNGDIDAVFERVATDCARQGYHPVYLSSGNSFDSSMFSAAGIKDSSWYNSGNLPCWDKQAAVQPMNAAVNKYYPGLINKPAVWTGESTVSTWAAGLLMADAVKAGGLTATGTPSAAEITQGLESLKGDTLEGLAPSRRVNLTPFTAGSPSASRTAYRAWAMAATSLASLRQRHRTWHRAASGPYSALSQGATKVDSVLGLRRPKGSDGTDGPNTGCDLRH